MIIDKLILGNKENRNDTSLNIRLSDLKEINEMQGKEEGSSTCPRKLRWDNNSFTENVQTPSQLATGTPRPTFGLEFLHFYISFNFFNVFIRHVQLATTC